MLLKGRVRPLRLSERRTAKMNMIARLTSGSAVTRPTLRESSTEYARLAEKNDALRIEKDAITDELVGLERRIADGRDAISLRRLRVEAELGGSAGVAAADHAVIVT